MYSKYNNNNYLVVVTPRALHGGTRTAARTVSKYWAPDEAVHLMRSVSITRFY